MGFSWGDYALTERVVLEPRSEGAGVFGCVPGSTLSVSALEWVGGTASQEAIKPNLAAAPRLPWQSEESDGYTRPPTRSSALLYAGTVRAW